MDRVLAIAAKDLRLFARDRFFTLVTALGLAFYAIVFWLLPATVEESVPVGLHLPGLPQQVLESVTDNTDQGFALTVFPSSQALEDAVREGEQVVAGLDLPAGFLDPALGITDAAPDPDAATPTVRLLLAGDVPPALRDALSGVVRELALTLTGQPPPVDLPPEEELVLGVNRAGDPVTVREQLRPLLVFFVLLVEMFALASLVASELTQRTITAVLSTPARVVDVLAAKTLVGTGLAFVQAALLAAVTLTLATRPGLVLLALLLGAVLVTGLGLLVGSLGQDFLATVFLSVLFFVPLAIPAFAVLFPGSPAGWVQVLPTAGLAEILTRVAADAAGWGELWPQLAQLAGWGVLAWVIGAAVLRRRVVRV